jgi:hypothetical protein
VGSHGEDVGRARQSLDHGGAAAQEAINVVKDRFNIEFVVDVDVDVDGRLRLW